LQPTLRLSRRLQGVSEEEDKEGEGKRRAKREAAEANVRQSEKKWSARCYKSLHY
jgi:hypothetical protein